MSSKRKAAEQVILLYLGKLCPLGVDSLLFVTLENRAGWMIVISGIEQDGGFR